MSTTASRIPEGIKNAMRAKNSLALNALRALKSALTNAAIEKGSLGTELEESEVLAVVRKQIKQRVDSCEQFEKAGRPELVVTEKAEIEILSHYLPAGLTAEELLAVVEQAVADTGASGKADMGKVMKRAQELAGGRADGKALSAEVMRRLAN
ncbi:MAG: GatB/YqeY domain-containing protein [Akkermansiaceae bacterium]